MSLGNTLLLLDPFFRNISPNLQPEPLKPQSTDNVSCYQKILLQPCVSNGCSLLFIAFTIFSGQRKPRSLSQLSEIACSRPQWQPFSTFSAFFLKRNAKARHSISGETSPASNRNNNSIDNDISSIS